MVPRACNMRFLKIVFNSARYSTFKHFLRWLRVRKNCFPLAQPVMEQVLRMLIQRYNIHSAYFQLILNDGFEISLMLSMRKKIGYSLAELSRKLVTWWSIMREDWSQVGWACAKIISAHHVHFQSFPLFPQPPIPLSSSPVPVLRSTVCPCLMSLYLVFRPMFPVFPLFPCLLSSVL